MEGETKLVKVMTGNGEVMHNFHKYVFFPTSPIFWEINLNLILTNFNF